MFRNIFRSITHSSMRGVWRLMRKPTKIIHFTGLRRSGNHACMGWVANAIYGRPVGYERQGHYLFRKYPDGRVFLINSYAQESPVVLFRALWKHRRALAKSDYLFLSLEDRAPDFTHFLRPASGDPRVTEVHVDRSIFNILASRAKKVDVEQTKPGGGIASNFAVDRDLLNGFFAQRKQPALQWDYDRWLVDPAFRTAFLQRIGLFTDILPAMSHEAGGSSFGDRDASEVVAHGRSRYTVRPVPEKWVRWVEDGHLGELAPGELEQLRRIRAPYAAKDTGPQQ